MDRGAYHGQLKEITRRYGHAMDRYDRAMRRGDAKQADDAIGEMQEIERSVTIIERPRK